MVTNQRGVKTSVKISRDITVLCEKSENFLRIVLFLSPELLLPIKAAVKEVNTARQKVLTGLSDHMDKVDAVVDPMKLVGQFLYDVMPWLKQALRSEESKQEEIKKRALDFVSKKDAKQKEVAIGAAWQELQVADDDYEDTLGADQQYRDYSDEPEVNAKPASKKSKKSSMPKKQTSASQDDCNSNHKCL